MGLLTLYSGLLLPWLGGTCWLIFAESRINGISPVNRLRQAGYGFFLGYAFLSMAIIVCHKLTGTVSWAGIMTFLLVCAVSGGILAWRYSAATTSATRSTHTLASTPIKILLVLLLVLLAIHIIFISVEVFTRPVYPWDAWLAWIYRSKAWFMAGSMAEIVSPTEWASATSTEIYTINAWNYPVFSSVIPYWAALSLGAWNETLVNLPVLFAGLAIGMATYGQCRDYGLTKPASFIVCYLLYSVPLFGTHIALAGYADIWMAGFAGLGFIALLRDTILREKQHMPGFQGWLGLLMILFSVWVKNEGAVWFLTAMLLLILVNFRARIPILVVSFISLLWLLAFVLDITHLDLPVIGQIGYVDGRFVIPFIAQFIPEVHDIKDVYWENFVKMGSWNLLWVFLTVSLLTAFRLPGDISMSRIRRVTLSFILIFLSTQVLIFGFTNRGVWADSFTAINRLPLHFLPALLFAIALMANASISRARSLDAPPNTRLNSPLGVPSSVLIAIILATTLVFSGTAVFLSKGLPGQPAKPLEYPATGLTLTLGTGHPGNGRMLVNSFENGYALLSSGPVSLRADKYRVLSYAWLPSGTPREAAFFWRRSNANENVERTENIRPGNRLLDLTTQTNWQGEITEFGFLFAGHEDETVEIGNISLIPDNLMTRWQLAWQSWVTFEKWSHQSINFLDGGDYSQLISLPLLITSWLLSALLLIWLFTRFGKNFDSRKLLMIAGMLSLLAWVLLDIRWAFNNLEQIRRSGVNLRSNADEQPFHGSDQDEEIYRYIQRLKTEVLGDKNKRILIVGNKADADYYLLRAKYHLLPHSARISGFIDKRIALDSLDYVILFAQPTANHKVPGLKPRWKQKLIQVDSGDWGVVYRVE